MATLDNKSIRGSLNGAFKYINHPDKNLPSDGLSAAAAYIRGGHSVERLYSRGHNGCSGDPELALQQFRTCEALYRRRKGGARESGLTESKKPIIAEHFFLSFPTEEKVPYKTQCEIADKLCASPILNDFYAVSNRHWNTDNDHSHILVCNVNKDGTRKLSMSKTKRKELRKELDRICALDYGLSIIDDPALRYDDPDREQFVRDCVGKVNVYAPADYKRVYNPCREYDKWMLAQIAVGAVKVADGASKNRKGLTQADAYRRWIVEQPDFTRDVDKKEAKRKPYVLISDEQAESKAARAYYWDKRYRSSEYPKYYYAVRIYDEDGRRKSTLRLMIELMLVVMDKEYLLWTPTYQDMGDKREKFFASTNWDIQRGYDAMHIQDQQGVRTPAELAQRIQAVGTDLSEARQGYTYYKRACEINPDDYYAKLKVGDLDKRIQTLKKDYRDLKFVEAHIHDCQYEIERQLMQSRSLDDLINRAQSLASAGQKKISENLQKNY